MHKKLQAIQNNWLEIIYKVEQLVDKGQGNLHSAVAVACIHSHRPGVIPASASGHSLPSTTCSWQSAFYSLSGGEKLPSFVFHGIYKEKLNSISTKFPEFT